MRAFTTRALVVGAALTFLVLTAAGCTSPEPGNRTTSPVPEMSTSSIEESQAVTDATAALHRFYEVRSQCLSDPPNADASCFDAVAVDQVLTDSRTTLENLQRDGLHYEGDREVLSVDVIWINLDGTDQQIRLAACVDQRAWRLVDASGAQLSSVPTAPQRVVWQLINHDYPAADEWKVAYYPEEDSASC